MPKEKQPLPNPKREQRRREIEEKKAARVKVEQQKKAIRYGFIGFLIIAGIVILVLVLFFVVQPGKPATGDSNQGGTGQTIDGIPCVQEMLTYHHHAHLTIYINGQVLVPPANTGIVTNGVTGCLYYLHVHPDGGQHPNYGNPEDDGIIHMEAPAEQNFTLGEFFDIWGQPLSNTNLIGNKTDATHHIYAFIDGQPYTGDLRQLQMNKTIKEDIVLEYGTSPDPATPPQYPWQADLNQ